MRTLTRWEPFRGTTSLQDQVDRLFSDVFERKGEKKVNVENYLRVERAYGSFARSFTLASTVNSEAIKADYQNGVLTLSIPKREEAKPKHIKVNVGTPAMAASA